MLACASFVVTRAGLWNRSQHDDTPRNRMYGQPEEQYPGQCMEACAAFVIDSIENKSGITCADDYEMIAAARYICPGFCVKPSFNPLDAVMKQQVKVKEEIPFRLWNNHVLPRV